jgi:hypothetical protein
LPTNFTYLNRSAINSSQAENKQHFRIVFIGHGSILIKQGRSKRPIVLTSSLRIEDENCFKNIRSELTYGLGIDPPSITRINTARFNYASAPGNPDSIQPKFALGRGIPYKRLLNVISRESDNPTGRHLLRQYISELREMLLASNSPYFIAVIKEVGYALCELAKNPRHTASVLKDDGARPS